METTRILIVEDEFILAEDIAMRLRKMNYHVVGLMDTAMKVLNFLEKDPSGVDMLLLDISIKGTMDGIELGRIIRKTYGIPFIFLSSYSNKDYVERAKEAQPAAYMLKPFNDNAIRVTIEMALVNFSKGKFADSFTELKPFKSDENQAMSVKGNLFLKKNGYFERVAFEDILYLEAQGNYTLIYTKQGQFLHTLPLSKVEEKLPPNYFLRIHRSYVANMPCVTKFIRTSLKIGETEIPVSRSNQRKVMDWFEMN